VNMKKLFWKIVKYFVDRWLAKKISPPDEAVPDYLPPNDDGKPHDTTAPQYPGKFKKPFEKHGTNQ
jgi:hypothetical protein